MTCNECKYYNVDTDCHPCNKCCHNTCGIDSSYDYFERVFERVYDCNKKTSKIMQFDNVNHPNHYTGKYECIDAMRETQGVDAVKNFCICNAFKYLWRHGKKNGVEDVKKAAWYLNKFIELEKVEKDG